MWVNELNQRVKLTTWNQHTLDSRVIIKLEELRCDWGERKKKSREITKNKLMKRKKTLNFISFSRLFSNDIATTSLLTLYCAWRWLFSNPNRIKIWRNILFISSFQDYSSVEYKNRIRERTLNGLMCGWQWQSSSQRKRASKQTNRGMSEREKRRK